MPIDVLTNRYNPGRTGANLDEATLNQSNVNVNSFGKVFTRNVDGQIYAQPLIVRELTFPDIGRHSAVFVATTRNMVYAFDAEDPEACHPFWRVNLDEPGATPVPRSDYGGGYTEFTSEIGVTSTPAIDRTTATMFLTAKSKKKGPDGKPHYRYRLHALDLLTGADKLGGPSLIAETIVNDPEHSGSANDFTFVTGPKVAGTGKGNTNGEITFNAFLQLQRPGLLLQDGAIFAAFASHGDIGSYHGWVLAFDAGSLALIAAYCTTPDWGEGGIWQSGCGLAGDGAGNVYAICGNGTETLADIIAGRPSDAQLAAKPGYGHSVLKMRFYRAAGQLDLVDWFTPFDIRDSNMQDKDLCAGPVLLPWGNVVGAWGKDRAYYIMDRDNLGKFTPGRNAIVQYAPDMTGSQHVGLDPASWTGHIHCAPVVFDDPARGPVSYVWGENDRLRGYRFDPPKRQFETKPPPFLLSHNVLPVGMPGGMLTVSCNGNAAGSAIVWTLHPTAGNANHATVAGTLQAYKADDLTLPIWSSNHDPRGSDDLGDFAKFCPPVVANGRVYVATFSQQLVVYGLLSEGLGSPIGNWLQEDIPVQGPGDRTFRVEGTASFSCNRFTILGTGSDIWGVADAFHYVYQPVSSNRVEISARVMSVDDTDEWAKAGVMIRESLDANAAQAMVVLTPTTKNGAAFQYRPTKGGVTIHVPFATPVQPPFWVRVVRTIDGGASECSGFVSADGVGWQQIGSTVTVVMAQNALAGMAVTAHVDPHPLQDLCTAVIDRVTLAADDAADAVRARRLGTPGRSSRRQRA